MSAEVGSTPARGGRRSAGWPVAVALIALAGCTGVPPQPPAGLLEEFPSHRPRAVVTNFNSALVCMDNLMVIHQSKPIYVTSQGILNFTSDRSLSNGGKEMLITALAQMSNRSRGVRFVSYGSDIRDVLDLQGAHPDKKQFRVPDYFLRGGVTEHNKTLWSGQEGAGFSGEVTDGDELTASYSLLGGFGSVTVDMSAGHVANLQIVPGAVSANTLSLRNTEGKSATADLLVGDFGFSYSLSDNVSRDFNQILRALIQVGAIELVGKLQNLPYWRCLANAGANEQRDGELRARFNERLQNQRSTLVREMQQLLRDSGYYNGPINGVPDDASYAALQSYQRHHNILATGRIDFETYRLMHLYTPSRDLPYVQWWEDDPKTARTGAPYGPAATVAIPVSE